MTIKKSSILKNESGAALVIALITMIVLTLIGLASIFSSTFEMKLSGRKKGSTNAFYAADGGVDVLKVNIQNFSPNNPNPYPAFTDPVNIDINPTLAAQIDADAEFSNITYNAAQIGAPRGYGISATQFEFEHFVIAVTGRDQTNVDPVPSRCTVEEKVIRVIPNLQGGT